MNIQINAEEEWGQRKAQLAPAGLFTQRLTSVLKVGPGGYSFASTYLGLMDPIVMDTVVGDDSSRFTQQLRAGDVLEFLDFNSNIIGVPAYVVREVIDDQNFVVAPLIPDFTSGNIFVSGRPYSASVGGIADVHMFPPTEEIRAYSPQGSDKSPFPSEYLFRDWTSTRNGVNGTGEARNDDANTDFNKTLSHISIEDSGHGYYMPVEVFPIGGAPSQQSLIAWVEANNTFPIFQHARLQIESNATDSNGTILDGNFSIRIVDPGYGYEKNFVVPDVLITGGGGMGAMAVSHMGDRFIVPIGDSLLSVGMINLDLTDANNFSTLLLEQNGSLTAGDLNVSIDQANDRITVQYNTVTIQDLLDELNDPANALLFDPNSTVDGNASLISGSATTLLSDLNITSLNGISAVEITAGQGGRGYINLDPNNIPRVLLDFNVSGQEKNASLSVRLGGQIEEIPPCSTCETFKDTIEPIEPSGYFLTDFHEHTGPYIEIWDKGRNERDINDIGIRALAVPKMRNGRIEKVIVVESGNGYIDPIARVRGIATRHGHYDDGVNRDDHYESRIWMCSNIRETKGGEFVKCGHIEKRMYPPENCPGEVDGSFPVGPTASAQAITDWQNRHDIETDDGNRTLVHSCNDGLVSFGLMDGSMANLDYSLDTQTHYNVGFKVRVCDGKKANFVLLNDPYRHPYENWEIWDANLSVITQQGKIKEIIVDHGGEMYLGGEVVVSGSGGEVDAIPVIRHDGFNTMIIFDDPNLKNLELDNINNPLGAGMGFQERPWSWDSNFAPIFGPNERPVVHTGNYDDQGDGQYSSVQGRGPGFTWVYGNPTMGNFSYGDRIDKILVHDFGLFESNRTIDEVNIEYNGSSSAQFKPAKISANSTFRLTKIFLDENATYLDRMDPQDDQSLWRWRSLYEEQPSFNILDRHGNNIAMVEQNASDFIRANGNGNYLYSEEGAYFDLYVDDRIPDNFYYGFGRGFAHLPVMGAEIKVTEPIPGLSWGVNEGVERNMSVFTDQHGFYLMPDLEPGMYNVAVFMEDENFQESTFRPSSNPERVSQILYVPGFEPLRLESDNYGYGKSKLVWSKESRSMSRANGIRSGQLQELHERKILDGIGAGFRSGETPEITIVPDSRNTTAGIPNISTIVLVDGSLRISIIDDVNTSAFNPNDQFTVHYSSTINGVDFVEDYPLSLSENASWAGSASSQGMGEPRLNIFPNDGNGMNAIEIPLSTSFHGDTNVTFYAKAFDENGTALDTSGVQWKLVYDFNSSEGNNSNMASISNPQYFIRGDDGANGYGYYYPVYVNQVGLSANHLHNINAGVVYMEDTNQNHAQEKLPENSGLIIAPTDFNQSNGINLQLLSTLRKGRVERFEVVSGGINYSDGSEVKLNGTGINFAGVLSVSGDGTGQIIDVNISNPGTGYNQDSQVIIVDENGTGAVLKPILGGGEFHLEANMTHDGNLLVARVKLVASERNQLTPQEKWLNLYMDSLEDRNASWWNDLAFDLDGDGLTNYQELLSNSNPMLADTDGDGVPDATEFANGTSLRMTDTDGDGLDDLAEEGNGTNPLYFDTDSDGWSDAYEVSVGLNPLVPDADFLGHISGLFLNTTILQGNVNAFIELNNTLGTFSKTINLGAASIYPQYFFESSIPNNTAYQAFAFIDRNGNGSYSAGEPFGQWEGNVTSETELIKIQVLDPAPSIQFAAGVDQNISINPSPENHFPSGVVVEDLYEGVLTQANITIEGNGTAIVDRNQTSGLCSVKSNVSPGYYELNFFATDGLGTMSEIITLGITLLDVTSPTLLLFQDNIPTLEAGSIYSEPGFYAYDNVDGEITSTVTYPVNFSSQIPGDNYITYTVSDSAGNSNSTQRSITVVDTTPPKLTLLGDSSVTHEVGEFFNDPNATWVDIVDGNGTVSANNSVNINLTGTQLLTYNYTDTSNNISNSVFRDLNLVDTTPAFIFLNGNATIIHEAGQPFVDPGSSWIDTGDGNGTVQGLGDLNVSKLGEYELVYSYIDQSSNPSDSIIRKVQVVDTIGAQLQLIGDQNVTTEAGFPYVDQGATWVDAVDGNGTVSSIGSVNVQFQGIYLLTYSYTDQAGNVGQPFDLSRTVTVKDTKSPVIVFPQNEFPPILLGENIIFAGIDAFDLFDGNVTSSLQVTYPVGFDANKSGSYLVNFSVADNSGNITSVNKRIHILDAATHNLTSTLDASEEGWFSSSWLGSFYPTGGSWIYHLKLGWLNVRLGGSDGYWIWDFHFQSWWWTSPSVFPYYYLEGENNEWHYLKLDLPVIQYYDFKSQQWKSRP